MSVEAKLKRVLNEARACSACAGDLASGPRPIVQLGVGATMVIISQAPGRRVHDSGIPWDDASGIRLREWLGLSVEEFYDPSLVALMPMGFCFPGSGPSGDLPPRPLCAPLWHPQLLPFLAHDRLTVILGAYAQQRYLPQRSHTLTETVARWAEFLPDTIVLPHPSPRNNRWFARNPWFEAETLPAVGRRVADARADRRPRGPGV